MIGAGEVILVSYKAAAVPPREFDRLATSATLNLVALIHYIFPGMLVIARAYDEAHAEELRLAGAGHVILELSPTSRQFASHISDILKD